MQVQSSRRYETCLSTDANRNQIKYLRDKITCKLSPASKKKGESLPRIKVTKMVSAKPASKSTSITSTLSTSKDLGAQLSKIRSKTNVINSSKNLLTSESVKKTCKTCSLHLKSKLGTGGVSKKKTESIKTSKEKLTKSPDLVSPHEVKKVARQMISTPPTFKSAKAIVVDKPKINVSRPPTPLTITKTQRMISSGSTEKLVIPKRKKANTVAKAGGLLKKKSHSNKEVKCAGRAAGTEIIKKLKKMEDEEKLFKTDVTNEIQKQQRDIVQSNTFFQHLLLGTVAEHKPPQPKDLIKEKTEQLQRKQHSYSEPSVDAGRIYLQYVKPVSESKFRSLNTSDIRSRSVSPISIKESKNNLQIQTRSISLPPKLKHSSSLACSSSDLGHSISSIDSLDKYNYHCYIKELVSSNRASNKFRQLSQFYSTLERMGQLELTTSTTDVKPRLKSEDEIIDYDRWKELKKLEKAERELQMVYFKLKSDQKERGLLFRPKDVDTFKWKRELDRGLRIKDKSVENIKESFEKLNAQPSDLETTKLRMLNYEKDTYKPHWRGSSVLNLVSQITEKRSLSESRVPTSRQGRIESERSLLTRGVGSRIWSSLSLEQVNVLRNQLSEIYGQNAFRRLEEPSRKLELETLPPSVPDVTRQPAEIKHEEVMISENDKRKLSQSLSTEALNHFLQKQQRYKTSVSLVLGKEIRGAVAATEALTKFIHPEVESPRTCYSLELSDDGKYERKHKDNEFVLVLAKNDSPKGDIKETLQEWAQPKRALVKTNAVSPPKVSSTSETESGSTDDSAKTVVCVDKKDDVQKKVQYFEQSAKVNTYVPTIYKAANSEQSSQENISDRLSSSQSQQDLAEYFGESDLVRLATVPLSAIRKQPKSPGKESIFRSRSLSPYFGEAYSLVRTGDVHRLKTQFESLNRKNQSQIRRWKSDSHLNRNNQKTGLVDLLRKNYEYPAIAGRGRSRSRRGGVVSPVFLRAEDRLMPHINIISKIANLYTRKPNSSLSERSKSNEELAAILGCPVGEVEKLRQKFDRISLLGHLFTSSPSIHELRSIAPHLAAEWTAHRFPHFEDNARSLSSPESSPASRDLPIRKSKSASPSSRPSILKSPEKFSTGGQYHGPVIHRSWWSSTYKPSVKFKGVL